MDFNKKSFDAFREDFTAALAALEKKYDVKVELGKITYNDLDFTMQTKFVKTDLAIPAEEQDFNRLCSLFGFEPTDYNRQFTMGGKTFTLYGFHPNKPKNNCAIREVTTGKAYMANSKSIQACFLRTAKA